MKSIKENIFMTIFRGAFTWGITTVVSAYLIFFVSFDVLGQVQHFNLRIFLISFMGLFEIWFYYFLKYALLPAFAMGLIQAFWFYRVNEKWGSLKSRQGFSYFSGVVFGLLCFLVAYVLFGGFSQWALFNCLLFSSMAGGAYGAHVNRKRLPPLVMGRGKTLWREIIFSYFLIVLLIFLFWFLVFGNTVWVRLNKNASVHSMAQKVTPVSGKGVFLSGIFKLGNQDEILSFDESSDTETVSLTITKNEYSRIKGKAKEALYRDFINRFHRFNQSLKITQNDGVLTVKDYTGAEWRGTVDVQGAFKVNGKIVKGDVVTNLKFEGSFHDRDHINYYLSYWEQEGKSGREATCVGTGERLK